MARPPLPMTRTFLTSTCARGFTTPLSKYAFGFGAVWVAPAPAQAAAAAEKSRFWVNRALWGWHCAWRMPLWTAVVRVLNWGGETGIRRPCRRSAGARPALDTVDSIVGRFAGGLGKGGKRDRPFDKKKEAPVRAEQHSQSLVLCQLRVGSSRRVSLSSSSLRWH